MPNPPGTSARLGSGDASAGSCGDRGRTWKPAGTRPARSPAAASPSGDSTRAGRGSTVHRRRRPTAGDLPAPPSSPLLRPARKPHPRSDVRRAPPECDRPKGSSMLLRGPGWRRRSPLAADPRPPTPSATRPRPRPATLLPCTCPETARATPAAPHTGALPQRARPGLPWSPTRRRCGARRHRGPRCAPPPGAPDPNR